MATISFEMSGSGMSTDSGHQFRPVVVFPDVNSKSVFKMPLYASPELFSDKDAAAYLLTFSTVLVVNIYFLY